MLEIVNINYLVHILHVVHSTICLSHLLNHSLTILCKNPVCFHAAFLNIMLCGFDAPVSFRVTRKVLHVGKMATLYSSMARMWFHNS